jgi:CHASE3 domain sensor protein
MATTKETSRLIITTKSDETCSVKSKGDMEAMARAIASLLLVDDEKNMFREIMLVSSGLALEAQKLDEKKAARKKKAAKKKK